MTRAMVTDKLGWGEKVQILMNTMGKLLPIISQNHIYNPILKKIEEKERLFCDVLKMALYSFKECKSPDSACIILKSTK